MKKNYFFGALMSLMLVLFALPVKAQVESLADLFGKYQFTADMEVMAGMDKYAEQLSADCEAEISKGAIYDAQIVGFAGATSQMNINAISTEKEMIKVTNPNNPQLWDALYLANENGDYPYGVFDNEKGEWTVESYGPVYMSYDPETKLITIPDFTVVTCDHANSKATVVAKFTNVKMTLKESVEIEVADLSGSWHATPLGAYGSNSESSIPAEYDFVLTKTGEDNKNYNAELTIGGFAPVTLPATFDGVSLAIHAKDVVLDATTGAVIYYNGSTDYAFTFSYASETTLSMSTPLCIGLPNTSTEEDAPKYVMEQWYMDGTAKRDVESGESFDWAGTWTVKGEVISADGGTYPSEFEMEITYMTEWDMYLITKFFGNDIANMNQGGIMFSPSTDDPNKATFKTGGLVGGAYPNYYKLYDGIGGTADIQVTKNDDGTISIGDFFIQSYNYDTSAATPAAFYQGVTASKPAEEEVVEFDWAGIWNVKAGQVASYDGKEYPSEFEMEVTYMAEWDMYLVTKFMGNDVANMNQGGILLTPSEDGMTAELKTGTLVGGSYPTYLKMYDMNATTSPVIITRNADGTLSIANFYVKTLNYDTSEETPAVFYQSVTASKDAVEEEPVEPFEWTGVWNVKSGKVDAYDGKEYPAEFEMEVTYNADYDMYLVTKFMGSDVSSINYGGILLTPSEDNKTAELQTGKFAGGSYPDYLKIYDMNATTSPVAITVNEDGSLTIANFFLKSYNWDTKAESAAVYYQNVTATKGASSIESVKTAGAAVTVAGGVINIAGGAQSVQVYDAAGRLEFSGVASSVANLSKGIHIVKVGGTAVKVAVK